MILSPDGRPLARGDLYTDLYYPLAPDVPVRLVFVERDVFQDDRVAALDLEPGMERCTLTDAGDFVQFERTPVQPDRNSGADARPIGARVLSGDFADQVDFREGDYTDYIRLPEGPATLLLVRENFALDWDLPGVLDVDDVRMNRFPGNGSNSPDGAAGSDAASQSAADKTAAPFVYPDHPREAVILRFTEADRDRETKPAQPVYLRLRSTIGGGRQSYRIFVATGPGADEKLFNRWLVYLRSQKVEKNDTENTTRADFGFARLADLSNAFIALRGQWAAAACRAKIGLDRQKFSGVPSGSGADRERVFCAHLLYTLQARSDLQALVARYERESKFYQDALWSVDRQARRTLEEQASR